MRPNGITNHFSRIYVEDPLALSNEDFIAGTTAIAENTLDAVKSVDLRVRSGGVLQVLVTELTEQMAALSLQGPKSRAILDIACEQPVDALKYFCPILRQYNPPHMGTHFQRCRIYFSSNASCCHCVLVSSPRTEYDASLDSLPIYHRPQSSY